MADDYTVLTPENVLLQFEVAGIGSRFAAAVVDYLIVSISYIALALGAGLLGDRLDASDVPALIRSSLAAILVLLAFLLWWGYFVLFELLWNGQSPGKRLLHLRVSRADGLPISPVSAVTRNLMRIVDLPLFIGVIVMVVDARGRRLGDLAAGTLVVRESSKSLHALDALAEPAIPDISPGHATTFETITQINRAQYALLRDYFTRQPRLAPDTRQVVARALAEDVADTCKVPKEQIGDAVDFLAAAVRNYERSHLFDEP